MASIEDDPRTSFTERLEDSVVPSVSPISVASLHDDPADAGQDGSQLFRSPWRWSRAGSHLSVGAADRCKRGDGLDGIDLQQKGWPVAAHTAPALIDRESHDNTAVAGAGAPGGIRTCDPRVRRTGA